MNTPTLLLDQPVAVRNESAQKKAEADRKAAAQKKAEADRKAAAQKKAAAISGNKIVPTKNLKTVSEKKREEKTELLKISVYLDTGKVLAIASLGVAASALVMTALAFIAKFEHSKEDLPVVITSSTIKIFCPLFI